MTSSPFETIWLEHLQFQHRFDVNGFCQSFESEPLNLMGTPSSLRQMDDLFHRLAGQMLVVISPNCLRTNPRQ